MSSKTQLSEVEGRISFTINLGNYESVKVEYCEKRVVNKGTSDDEAYAELNDSLEKQIAKTLAESVELKKLKK